MRNDCNYIFKNKWFYILSFVKLNTALQLSIPGAALSGVSAIAGGGYHTIALKNGDVFAWGHQFFGQTDVLATATFGVTAIAGGYSHTIALKDGAVLAWGDNSQGQRTILDACEVATVTRAQPISGPSTGGTAVKIIGTNFFSALPVAVIWITTKQLIRQIYHLYC